MEGGKEDIFPPPVTAADIDRPVGDLRGSDAREVDTQTASAPLVTSTAVRDEEFRDYLTGSAAGQTASGMRAVSESGGGGAWNSTGGVLLHVVPCLVATGPNVNGI